MKKLLMISIMLFIGAVSMSAQTYYYKYLYTVDKESGVKKSKGSGWGEYYTFTNNKNHCYKSDKEGNISYVKGYNLDANSIMERITVYNYESTQNGMHIYRQTKVETGGYGFIPRNVWGGTGIYTFSNDFSRMNISGSGNDVKVYERSTPNEEQSTPSQLY